jgi:para-nitrobenzyl esterase
VSLQAEQTPCRTAKQCASSDRIIKNPPQRENQQLATPFFRTLLVRNNVVKMARLKHELSAAPAYTYYFTWQTPMLDGIPGAWHTADLQFCFDNTKRCEQGTGNTPEAQVLARKMANAWANFARTGNPSQPGLQWQPTDPERNPTMIFDNQCRMADDPEGEARKILLS